LPGEKAQYLMAPIGRKLTEEIMRKSADPKPSGVLILLYPKSEETHFLLIERNRYPGVHSGQISLPGGGQEARDPDLETTALREAEEEVGVDHHTVTVIRSLTQLYVPPSNFLIQPVCGYTNTEPVLIPDTREVVQILQVPVSQLMDDRNIRHKPIKLALGFTVDTPYFDLLGQVVWGATAMILSEFREWVRQSV